MGWGRWSIVLGVLGLFLLWLRMSGKRWPPFRFVFPASLVGYLFSILGQDRGALQALFLGKVSEDSLYKEKRSMFEEVFDALDFANYDYLLYIIKHIPGSTGTYTYGLQHLQLFTEPIPRALWSGKPAGAPIQFFNLSDYGNFVGLTYSVVGDGWASGGFVGVFFTIAILAMLLGAVYRFFLKFDAVGHVGSLCYICFAALFVQIFRDGSLVTLVKFSAFVLLPVLFASMFKENSRNYP